MITRNLLIFLMVLVGWLFAAACSPAPVPASCSNHCGRTYSCRSD